jgi:GTP-binding protein HflX
VYAANQLFATLDPTLRRMDTVETGPVIYADTVGFIRHLPHDLIEAFQATLEEVSEADLLLHVIDAQDENKDLHIEQVNQVLESIGAQSVPRLLIYNKIDLCPHLQPQLDRDELGKPKRVMVSATKGLGLTALREAIGETLAKDRQVRHLVLAPSQAKIRAALYAKGAVIEEKIDEEGNYHLTVRMSQVELELLFR